MDINLMFPMNVIYADSINDLKYKFNTFKVTLNSACKKIKDSYVFVTNTREYKGLISYNGRYFLKTTSLYEKTYSIKEPVYEPRVLKQEKIDMYFKVGDIVKHRTNKLYKVVSIENKITATFEAVSDLYNIGTYSVLCCKVFLDNGLTDLNVDFFR